MHLFGHVHDENKTLTQGGVVFSNAALDKTWRPHVLQYPPTGVDEITRDFQSLHT